MGGSVMVAPETRWQKQWKDIEDKVRAALLTLNLPRA